MHLEKKIKVYVAGSFNTIEDIMRVRDLQEKLRKEGFYVLDQLKPFEWRRIYNFLEELELGRKIVEYDLKLIEEADVLVALADKPSFGTGAEVIYAKRVLGKKVLAIAIGEVRSPWVLVHSDKILRSLDPSKIAYEIRNLCLREIHS